VSDLLILFGVHASVRINWAGILDLALGWGRFLALVRCGRGIGLRLRIDVFNDFLYEIIHSEDFDLACRVLLLDLLGNCPFTCTCSA
jgi:hypothetical protein